MFIFPLNILLLDPFLIHFGIHFFFISESDSYPFVPFCYLVQYIRGWMNWDRCEFPRPLIWYILHITASLNLLQHTLTSKTANSLRLNLNGNNIKSHKIKIQVILHNMLNSIQFINQFYRLWLMGGGARKLKKRWSLPRLYKKVGYSRCATIYGKCRLPR